MTRRQGRELAARLGARCPYPFVVRDRLLQGLPVVRRARRECGPDWFTWIDWRAWGEFLDLLGLEDEPEPEELRRLWGELLAWAFRYRKARERGDDYRDRPRPQVATCACPGTAEKALDMADRADRGEGLFHAGDARDDEAGRLRVPVHSDGNHAAFDWQAVDERHHRLTLVAGTELQRRRARDLEDCGCMAEEVPCA